MNKTMTTILGILILTVLAFSACGVNKDAEVNAFVSDMDKVTGEITAKVNGNPTAAGVDEAQKVLDAKKADLKARYDKLKELRGYELSEPVMKKLTDSISKNMEAVADLQIKNVDKTVEDEAFGKKMNKLYTDYNSIFGV
jgi:Tfp pilus assembly protein PilP